MKRLGKGIVLISAATITIGLSSLYGAIQPIENNVEKQELKAYNSSASNILDNVFTRRWNENITNNI
jgi:hypothetical protein